MELRAEHHLQHSGIFLLDRTKLFHSKKLFYQHQNTKLLYAIAKYRKALLRYCKLDTFAMVIICELGKYIKQIIIWV